jgi:hypothetical protein
MIISSIRKLAYFHIPKTAGNSIRSLLYDVCLDARHIELQVAATKNLIMNRPTRFKSTTISLHTCQGPARQALESMGLRTKNFFEFVIVRNPYDRILSHYNYHIQSTKENIDFDTFLNNFTLESSFNNWFSKQIRWIENPLTDNLNIFKYEEIDMAWTTIRSRLNLDLPDLPKKNVTWHKTLEYLNTEQKAKCYDILKDDFESLGYDR